MAKYVSSEPLKRVDWRRVAACRDDDPELFFPIGTSGPAVTQAEQAREVCRGCPAIGYCALFAFEAGQDSGVWGGMTEQERRAVKRRNPGMDVAVFAQTLQDRFIETHPDDLHLPPIVPPEEPEAEMSDESGGQPPTVGSQSFRA
jgi:WhiB family redox-sensing transcriptional regulator